MPTAIDNWVESCREGTFPRVIARMKSGWAIMGERQVVPGYCLLLPDPVPPHLNAMREPDRMQFLADMARLGDAVLAATEAVRINYEMLGNQEPSLHAHLFPRYDAESEELRTSPIWFYDWEAAPMWTADVYGALCEAIQMELSDRRERS